MEARNLSAFYDSGGNAHLHRLNSLREFPFYLVLRRSFRKDVRKDFSLYIRMKKKERKGEESFHTLFEMHLKREKKGANFERLLLTV